MPGIRACACAYLTSVNQVLVLVLAVFIRVWNEDAFMAFSRGVYAVFCLQQQFCILIQHLKIV